MLYAILGLVVGIILGIVVPLNIPLEYSQYIGIAILAILDSLFGGISAQIKKNFHIGNFITGLLFYVFLSAFFIYIGEKLNLDLYLGVIVVLMFRMMQNIGTIRDFYFKKFFKEEKKEESTD